MEKPSKRILLFSDEGKWKSVLGFGNFVYYPYAMTSSVWPTSKRLEFLLLKVLAGSELAIEVKELDRRLGEILDLPLELREKIRNGNRTELQYRLAWVRTKAKKQGLVERVEPRSWKITEMGKLFLGENKS